MSSSASRGRRSATAGRSSSPGCSRSRSGSPSSSGSRSVTAASEVAVAVKLDNLGANILVLPQGATVDDYYTADIDAPTIPEAYVERIVASALPGVDNLSPKLTRRVRVGARDVVLTGILPSSEIASKPAWQIAGLEGEELKLSCDPTPPRTRPTATRTRGLKSKAVVSARRRRLPRRRGGRDAARGAREEGDPRRPRTRLPRRTGAARHGDRGRRPRVRPPPRAPGARRRAGAGERDRDHGLLQRDLGRAPREAPQHPARHADHDDHADRLDPARDEPPDEARLARVPPHRAPRRRRLDRELSSGRT